MDKTKFSKFFKDVQNGLSKHSPEILTGIGIAGMITTTVLAVKATPKALKLIEEAKDGGDIRCEKLPTKTVVKVTWKCYVPAAVTGAASVACLIGASSIHLKRNAALATAYQLSTTALHEYKQKVVETVGEETEKKVREKITQEKTDKVEGNKTIVISGDSDYLMYEPLSNQYFMANINKVDAAVNELNGRMVDGMEMSMSLNEFLDMLELKRSAIGNDIGWAVDYRLDLTYDDSHDDNGRPCLAIAYLVPPKYDFNKLY